MENAALLSSKIEETKENNEFTHKIGQQYHKPQNTVKRGNFGRFFNIFLSISSILYNKRFFFRMYNNDSPCQQFILNSHHCAPP